MNVKNFVLGVVVSCVYIVGENYLNNTKIPTTISENYQTRNFTTDLPNCKITDTNADCHLNFTGLDDYQAEILKHQIICNMELSDFKNFIEKNYNMSQEIFYTEYILLKAVFFDVKPNYLDKGCYQYDKVIFIKTFTEKMIKKEIDNYFTILQILAKIFLGCAVVSSFSFHITMIIYSLLSTQLLILLNQLITFYSI